MSTPTLKPETISIVKATAPVMAEHGYAITRTMYQHMFSEHPEVAEIFNQTHQVERDGAKAHQPASLAAAVHAYAAHIDDLGALAAAVERIAQKHVSLNVTAEQYAIVGKQLLGAVKEVLGDAATPEIMDAWLEAYQFLAHLFITREKDLYDSAAQKNGGWRGWREFQVSEKNSESQDVSSFVLSPVDGKNVAAHEAGQYVGLRLRLPTGKTVQRNYSLSSNANGMTLRLSVKREDSANGTPDGVVSHHLHNNVSVGDVIQVSIPAGDFVFNSGGSPVCLIGAGIGITPLVSMMKSLSTDETFDQKLHFLVVDKEAPSLSLHKEIAAVAESNENFSSAFHATKRCGRPSEEDFKKLLPVSDETHFYFCGPRGFMLDLNTMLQKWGVSDDRIHFEFFGPNDL